MLTASRRRRPEFVRVAIAAVVARSCLAIAGLVGAVTTTGCATNPVTGRRELHLLSEDREIALGVQNYAPAQQSQGGLYSLEAKLVAYISGIGHSLAAVSHRPNLPFEFVILNSSVPNAWAMPGGKIAVNRGLLTEMGSEAEIAAVLAHEIVHSTARHGAKAMERGMLFQSVLTGVAIAAKDHRDGKWATGAASASSGLTQLKYSRDAERESDQYGVDYMRKAGYDTRGAVQLQETFLRLKDGKRSNRFAALFSTHPPSEERVSNLRKLVANDPPGGRVGEAEYRAQIAVLERAEPAYEAYGKGRSALDEGQAPDALAFAETAISLEPREGTFYGLQGDAQDKLGNRAPALASFDQAIQRQDNYFYFHMRRGQLLQAMGREQDAQRALTRSNELLPTANAHYSLGILARKRGDKENAVGHFRAAATSSSEHGRMAGLELARMILPDAPDVYIKLSGGIDKDRRLLIQIHNTSPVPVRNIVIATSADMGASVKKAQIRYSGVLAPEGVVTVRSDLGRLPAVDPKLLNIQMRVVSAQVEGR
ncbi:MAG: M48 family metalloprotease [Verrucomicrobia bacterium]|nr:M48 family metalloprotease [Verrucomicrobiota bacterium]MDA1087199.1 M48 family metalloprotease [Verrucomicrobiota bacterium]